MTYQESPDIRTGKAPEHQKAALNRGKKPKIDPEVVTSEYNLEDYACYPDFVIKNIIIGKYYWFEYHCFESEESCDANLWHRTHSKVKVIKSYSPKEVDIPVFNVEFNDGFIGTVTIDELLDNQGEFERPDYKD